MEAATVSIVLERQAEDIHEPEFAAYAPLVSFEAYLSQQRMFGWVRLDADRLTDLLNAHEIIRLENVLIEGHRSGTTVSADEALVRRSEILAVIASGPRGDPARRLATRRYPVVVELGGYRIGGYVHTVSGVDPEDRLCDEGPMIPLTEAWLEYRSGVQGRRHDAGTVIVNRQLATRIEVVAEPVVQPASPPEGAATRVRPSDRARTVRCSSER
jgi:hypothetical protein